MNLTIEKLGLDILCREARLSDSFIQFEGR